MARVEARKEGESVVVTTTVSLLGTELNLRKQQLRDQIMGISAQMKYLTDLKQLAEAELAALEAAEIQG